MLPRARKRKTCSCCEDHSPSLTSSKPENATKRRRVGKTSLSTTEPIVGNVVERPQVNQSSQLVPAKVLAHEVEESNENILFESAAHSTRRMKNRRWQTIRGKEFVHTFIKEVTYTVATTRLGYVGQELLPFQKRHNFFQKSSSATPEVDAFVTRSEKSHFRSDDFVKNFTKARDDNDFNDRDSSFVDNDGDSVASLEKSSVDDDEFKDSDGDSGRSFEKSSVDDDEFKDSDSHFDADSDDDSVLSFEKSSVDDDEFKDSDSHFDADSDVDSYQSFEKSSVDDEEFNRYNSLFDDDSDDDSARSSEKSSVDDNDSDDDSVSSFEKSSTDDGDFKDSYSSFGNDNDGYSVGSSEKSTDDDGDSIDSESLPDLGSSAGNHARNFEKQTDDDNDSDHNESLEPDDDWACFSKFGFSCQWHKKIQRYCSCRRFLPCSYDNRPEPAPCPKELETLQEVFQSESNKKREYAILQEVNLGNDNCSNPCVYLYSNELFTICNRQQSNLRVDRTFNLGHCYVTIFALRNGNLIDNSSASEYGPLMTGPVMIHFDKSLSTYHRFFNTIRDRCGITKEPMTSGAISDMRRVPKKDHVITKAMRLSFGTNMSLCSNHNVPIALRTSLKKEVSCYSPVKEVVYVVRRKMRIERCQTGQAIYGNIRKSGWRLTEHAKSYMENWSEQSSAARRSSAAQLQALDNLKPEFL